MKLRHYFMLGILLFVAAVGALRSQTVNYFLTLNLNQIVTAVHQFINGEQLGPSTFANLPATPANGFIIYCSNCAQSNPCAGSGTGAFATYVNGAYSCANGNTASPSFSGTTTVNNLTITGTCTGCSSGTTNILAIPPPTGANAGLASHTVFLRIPATMIQATGSSVVVTFMSGSVADTSLITAATIGATLPGVTPGILTNPTTWTSGPTTITWPAGSFSATNTRYASNPVTFTVDQNHDYLIMVYIDSSYSGNIPYFVAASASPPLSNLGGILTGNHTADADASSYQTGPLYDGINGIVQVIN